MYEELKKLAEKAGGVEWIMIDGDCGIEADSRFITSDRRIREDKIPFAEIHYGHPAAGMLEPFQGEQVAAAEFIAAANPSAVLALIEQLEKIDADRKACWAEFKVQGRHLDELKAENARSTEREILQLAEIESLRKDAERLRWLRQNEFDIGSYHPAHEHNASAWFEHISDESIDKCIADESNFAKESGQ